MQRLKTPLLALLALVGGGALLAGALAGLRQERERAPLPDGPSPASIELLHAQPFQLDQPFVHDWRVEKPSYSAGYLLVLRTDPELVRPRQTYEAVLYVGDETAQRCNAGWPGGYLVALVPAELNAAGEVDLDPLEAPIWFGTPELPERVDAARIAQERALALDQGLGGARLSTRLQAEGVEETVYAADRDELDLFVADLIEAWSPEETGLLEMLRMPASR